MSVRDIQTLLNRHGYGLKVDGDRGPKTEAAIRDFQRRNGLAVDGIVGPKTVAALEGGHRSSGGDPNRFDGDPGHTSADYPNSSQDQLGYAAGTSGRLSLGQMKSLLIQQGASTHEASILSAVAMAESSGHVGAVNTGNRNGTHDYGLWQINSIWTNDGISNSSGPWDAQRLRSDPTYNARAALSIFRSQGYEAWATYNQGDYRKYLSDARTAPTAAVPQQAASRSSSGRTTPWGNPDSSGWSNSNIVTVSAAGHRFQVNKAYADNFVGFVNALSAEGYHVSSIGGYNNRNIAGSSKKSNHAWGAAIDINPSQNPRTAGGSGMRENMPGNIVQLARAYGLGWGGEWHNSKDPMHFEVIGAPSSATYDGIKAGGKTPDMQQALGSYRWLEALAGVDPQIADILRQYQEQGLTPDALQAKLEDSDWWRRHTANQRKLAELQASDPAEYANSRSRSQANLRQLAQSMGVTLSGSDFNHVFDLYFSQGWTAPEAQRYLARYFGIGDGPASGNAATAMTELRSLAKDYAVPLSDSTMQKWVQQVIAGTVTTDSFREYLIGQAKSLYPTLAAALDKGITVDQYMNPYRELAAQTLEISPDQVDWQNPKWSVPLHQVGKNGERVPMTLSDWQAKLRTDPNYGFDHTDNARQQAASLNTSLLKEFGNVGA